MVLPVSTITTNSLAGAAPLRRCAARPAHLPLPKALLHHPKLHKFVQEKVALCRPAAVHLCTGTQQEYDELIDLCLKAGTLRHLDPVKRPGCVIAWTDPKDVARAEKDTFICSKTPAGAGPTNNWRDPAEMKAELHESFDGCMQGRTMYVIPFSMGPVGSPFAKIGIELTDSAFVVANMRIMTRMGSQVMEQLGSSGHFVPCLHSVGRPLTPDLPADHPARSAWPCHIEKRRICHFVDGDDSEIWSFGSGYGGNSLLGKKCFALRIASSMAREQGWLAEHMLILGITNPEGVKRYIAAAFPSACGKTNLAMMQPSLPGWKVEVVGDDIAWMRPGPDGRLYAINPEFGFFGVAPGTSAKSNPNALETCRTNSIFTNVGVTPDGDIWWEGMSKQAPPGVVNWHQQVHVDAAAAQGPVAHPNSRFTTPISQCPVLDENWQNPQGVPIDAIIFGGRRTDTMPLVFQSRSWQHGTFLGACMRSQATAAADQSGLTFDPMAMRPFIGYNVKDYFQHWLDMEHHVARLPKIFHVNWFLKDAAGKFIWPGFGDNVRVLDWILRRVDGSAPARDTPIGLVPTLDGVGIAGLPSMTRDKLDRLLHVDPVAWEKELAALKHHFAHTLMKSDDVPLPAGIAAELAALEQRLLQQQQQ